MLSHIRARGTVILPQRTGPIADVLYSAAGNSADERYYKRGIIAYSFETGAQRIAINPTTGAITQIETGFQPCFAGRAPAAAGRRRANARRTRCSSTRATTPAMEFAAGNFGMIQGAYEYAKDTTAPSTSIEYSAAQTAVDPINFRFNWVDEPAVIRYTTDGSTPQGRLRRPAGRRATTTRARAVRRGADAITRRAYTTSSGSPTDIKGNQSAVQTQRLLVAADEEDGTVGGTVPATLSLSLGTPATFGAFTPGVDEDYTRRPRRT